MSDIDGLLTLSPYEANLLAAVWDRMFPADDNCASPSELGAITYLDHQLAGPLAEFREDYRLGLRALDKVALSRFGRSVSECAPENLDALIAALEAGDVDFSVPLPGTFFNTLVAHLQEGLFADPAYGGNRDKAGWRFLGHPGIRMANAAADHLETEAIRGEPQALADAGFVLGSERSHVGADDNYDPQAAVLPPASDIDVIIVGCGAVGSLAAHVLTAQGCRVLALEAGPWRFGSDFTPDELGSTYYTRGGYGAKFQAEAPSWRPDEHTPVVPAPYSLGRMWNGVGGSVLQWGGALRRNHEHHFHYRSHVLERWGAGAVPADSTLVDWPLQLSDVADYYTALEWSIGVAGDAAQNPFVPNRKGYPLPAARPFALGQRFADATRALGLHPYPTPVALNTRPYNNLPESAYNSFAGGFGPFDDDRWMPGHNWVPDALASGNLDLKTGCRVLRVVTEASGRATGVEYVDPLGQTRTARAPAVILASYTFENLRLMWLSADDRHPSGLGNNRDQLGLHYMSKHWNDVYGYVPDVAFNAQSGPSMQMMVLDDYASADFDCVSHGFIGGASPNIENQRLPLQISREPLPSEVPTWGAAYKQHLRKWQQLAALRFQPDSLPYVGSRLDLDPRACERTGLGLPVVRVTYQMRENEQRLIDFMRGEATKILRQMGATKIWNGRDWTGVLSSHDLGGARMGNDPAASVVSPDLEVHDTPGLYVFGGAVFPSMSSINPTLTLWALAYRAAEQLARRL